MSKLTNQSNSTQDTDLEMLESKLCDLDKSLLLGTEEGWESWMFSSGSYMVSLGLGTKRNGSIAFDTPLAEQMIEHLKAKASQ